MPRVSRRRFIVLAGAGFGASALSGCNISRRVSPPAAPPFTVQRPEPLADVPAPQPTPTPRPTPARGRELVTLMPGTDWATDGVAIHSGRSGPRVMVLGGVHGNEPGGWLAAEHIADWQVEFGSLLVLPRINWRSAAALERTLPGFADLNRSYPGKADGLPMQQMAAAIVQAGQDFAPELLFDLHESWAFFAERGDNGGTAFLGQTVSVGGGATEASAERVVDVVRAVNAAITPREEFYVRGVTPRPGVPMVPLRTPRPGATPSPSTTPSSGSGGVTFSGTSSLSLGRWIEGCVPVLVEMGQQDQPDSRRSALHQMLVRTLLDQSRML